MTKEKRTIQPDALKEDHLKYLDTLRETGVTNMYGARPWLQNAFQNLNDQQARDILFYWMRTFEVRHPK
jgi:hypothetical protein